MFGFTIAFLGFCVVLIWATVLEPRSAFPNAVNALYWTVSGLFGLSLAAGAGARAMAQDGTQQVMMVLDNAPTAAQLSVLGGLLGLLVLTGHRLATGPPEEPEDEPSKEAS